MEVNFYEMYLEEMALIPVLEAEEEEKVLALAATGDKEAKKRLVEGSLAKVAQMVKEYEGRELPMSDVVQEANVSQVMAKELGREATVAELAEKMKMTEDEVKDIMKLALDAITVNGEGAVSEEQQKEEE